MEPLAQEAMPLSKDLVPKSGTDAEGGTPFRGS